MKNHQKKSIQNDPSNQIEMEDLSYLEAVQALARMTYKSIYIIDHQKKSFEYISDNPLFLCGYSPEEVEQMGFDFYNQCIPPQELEIRTQIIKTGLSFFASIPIEERKLYTLSFDIHLIHKRANAILLHHEMTPLSLTPMGQLSKSIVIVSLSTVRQSGNSKIFKFNSPNMWEYHKDQKKWKKSNKPKLTSRELEILHYAIRGYSVQEIATLLCLTLDTIKFHRRNIMDKLQVSTITKAIHYAIVHKLL